MSPSRPGRMGLARLGGGGPLKLAETLIIGSQGTRGAAPSLRVLQTTRQGDWEVLPCLALVSPAAFLLTLVAGTSTQGNGRPCSRGIWKKRGGPCNPPLTLPPSTPCTHRHIHLHVGLTIVHERCRDSKIFHLSWEGEASQTLRY